MSQQSSGSKHPKIGASLDESTASISSSTNLPFSGKKAKKTGKKKKKKVQAPKPIVNPVPPAAQENTLVEQVAAGVARLEESNAADTAGSQVQEPAPAL